MASWPNIYFVKKNEHTQSKYDSYSFYTNTCKSMPQNYKFVFLTGNDPLVDVDPSDINSVAGVLKLYFRELREPLFPLHLFDELIACSSKYTFVLALLSSLLLVVIMP